MSFKKTLSLLVFFFGFAFLAFTDPASASELDTGDTAWILTSTALVLFMTIPGLALFYGGLVGKKNVLSVLMQCFSITAVVTVIWTIFGYSMAFDTTGMVAGEVGMNAFVGGFSKAFLNGVGVDTLSGTIPEVLFFAFQLTFAIITPALIIGSFAERMKFSAMLLFTGLWVIFCYFPIAHMVWGGEGSFLGDKGVIDFAGGIVVHITAGTAALVAAIVIGARRGYPNQLAPPHNLTLTMIGTAMLWVGWFGFNGGSALASGGQAAMAVVVTQISPCVAALTWIFLESVRSGKPSALGFVTGAIAGLAAITPASGTVGPLGAIVIGAASSILAYIAATYIKFRFSYDDALDVVGVHGVGGLVGIILVAIFASTSYGGSIADLDIGAQLGVQIYGGIFAVVYTAIVSYIVLKVVDMLVGLRVDEDEERQGLDITDHGEEGYHGI
ncbi:MAG: ammonium transporter [Candidatus Dadabacteria bacterium]|nr:ammonium transporter [Candidatus Dadabacteria bacterium]MYC40612.1 ammonium transporter [Candidatus Dadabacteria bacterium]MYH40174.1 ammonium transporter [Candidatus Dadabacteria bacterium]